MKTWGAIYRHTILNHFRLSISAAMAAPMSAFQERLQQMDATRIQRLALLQAEKDLQIAKSELLAKKLEDLRRVERRCLLLERRNAELAHQILAKKSQIDALDARYQVAASEYRNLKSGIEELERREKEREGFYAAKRVEMEEFKERNMRFVLDTREEVQKLRDSVSEMKLTLQHLQGNDGYLNNAQVAAVEARKNELLAEKDKLDKNLASSYHFRTLLQKQLQKMLISKDKRKKVNEEAEK